MHPNALALGVLLCAGLATSAHAQPPTPAQTASVSAPLAAAQSLYAQGNFPQAESAAQSLPDADKYSVPGLQLRAQLELTANHLAAAQAALLQARHLDPHNRTTLSLLGLAYWRADRFTDAAPFLEQSDQIAQARVAQSLAGHPAYLIEGLGLLDRIRLLQVDPLPVVAVRLNNTQVRYFLIDTAVPEVLLDPAVAAQLDLPDLGSSSATFAPGEPAQTGHSVLPSLALGLWVVHDVPVLLKSTAAYPQISSAGVNGKPLRIDGVLGTEFLSHFVATLDYPHAELSLRHLPATAASATPGAESASTLRNRMVAAGATPIPLRWLGDHSLLIPGTLVPGTLVPATLVPATLQQSAEASPTLQFFVDTGLAASGFTAPDSTWKLVGLVPNSGSIQPLTLPAITLGTPPNSVTRRNLPATAGAFPPQLEHSTGAHIGGLLGHPFLRSYAVTFDFANMVLWLQS